MNYMDKIKQLKACDAAVVWLEENQFASLDKAWQACERGDWMLWLIGRTMNHDDEAQLRKLTLAKARCSKLVVHLMKDERSRNAVEVAEQFGLGNATRQELADAAADAAAAYDATAAYVAARTSMLAKCANEVRSVYSKPPKWWRK